MGDNGEVKNVKSEYENTAEGKSGDMEKSESSVIAVEENDDGKKSSEKMTSSEGEVVAAANKFTNDGNFLAMFLANHQPKEKEADGEGSGKKLSSSGGGGASGTEEADKKSGVAVKKRKKQPSESSMNDAPRRKKVGAEASQNLNTVADDEHDARKNEFLRTIRGMEEAGLVTERGLGAGMVK